MARLLENEEVDRQLADLPGWVGDTASLTRTVTAPDFPSAIRVVDEVADIAEQMDHHPDIDIRWRAVTFAALDALGRWRHPARHRAGAPHPATAATRRAAT